MIGILGLGSIGLRHGKNLISMGYEVVGYDPNFDEVRCIKFGIQRWPREAVIEKASAIIVASPSERHLEDAIEIIDLKKPVFVEKPIATKFNDKLREVTMVGFNLRLHSCVKKAKEWLNAGLIGKPIWANFTLGQFNDRVHYLRDGVILNWSHELDLALYLCGGASVSGSSTHRTDSGQDDLTDILLTHENGCRSTVHLDYITKPEIREFTIAGTDGFLQAYLLTRRIYHSNGASFAGTDNWNENYIEEMQAFIDRIDGKETIGCTGAEGLEVLKICLEVRKQAGLEPETYEHVSLGPCPKCHLIHYSNEECKW